MSDLTTTIQRVLDLDAIEARAKAAQRYERAEGPAGSGEASWMCPLCDGNGEVEGTLFDAKEHASTIAAYGIGVGLARAESFIEHAAEDTLALTGAMRESASRVASLEAQLAAANARADAAERQSDHHQTDRNALELRLREVDTNLARVSAERDAARAQVEALTKLLRETQRLQTETTTNPHAWGSLYFRIDAALDAAKGGA